MVVELELEDELELLVGCIEVVVVELELEDELELDVELVEEEIVVMEYCKIVPDSPTAKTLEPRKPDTPWSFRMVLLTGLSFVGMMLQALPS